MRTESLLMLVALFLLGCGNGPAPKTTNTVKTAKMASFELNGYRLTSAEYWPYLGKDEPRYPEDVLWGFYPEKGIPAAGEPDPNPDNATSAAIACAEKAWGELLSFLTSNPSQLRAIVEQGKDKGFTPLFYLWMNDYTRAADPYPHEVRPSKLWYWKRKIPDPKRPAGYWKWESTLTRSGECQTPRSDQIRAILDQTLDELTHR
jgi:hypothetical protein